MLSRSSKNALILSPFLSPMQHNQLSYWPLHNPFFPQSITRTTMIFKNFNGDADEISKNNKTNYSTFTLLQIGPQNSNSAISI